MTYMETPQMNHPYRESEVVLLFDATEAFQVKGSGDPDMFWADSSPRHRLKSFHRVATHK